MQNNVFEENLDQPIINPQEFQAEGATPDFAKHFQIWRVMNVLVMNFLFFSILMAAHYSIKTGIQNIQLQNFLILSGIALAGLMQLLFSIFWQVRFSKLEYLLDCAKNINEMRYINNFWNTVEDMLYQYRYHNYYVCFCSLKYWGKQFKLGQKFKVYQYTRFGFYFISIFSMCVSGLVIYQLVNQSITLNWETMSILILFWISIFLDIIDVLLGLVIQLPQYFRYLCLKSRSHKVYETGKIKTPMCAICLQDYEQGDNLYQLQCSPAHHFHKACLKQWYQQDPICPYCRTQFEFID